MLPRTTRPGAALAALTTLWWGAAPRADAPAQTPGRQLLLLDFAGTAEGTPPAGVHVTRGSLAVVTHNGTRMLRAATPSEFTVDLPEVLPETFTLEFDLVPKHCCAPEDLAFEGTASQTRSTSSADVVWDRTTQLVFGGGPYFRAEVPAAMAGSLPGQLTRIIATIEGTTLRMYTNGQRLYTLTDRRFMRGRVLRVFLGGQDADQQAVYLARLRVSEGRWTSTVAQAPTSTTTPTTASTSQAATAAPTSVTGLTVVLDAQGKAKLSWTAVPDASGYAAMRWSVDDPSCCKNLWPTGGATATEWLDGALSPDGTYAYRVYATLPTGTVVGETRVTIKNGVLSSGETIASAGSGTIASAAPPPPPPPPPPAPIPLDQPTVNRTSTRTVMNTGPAPALSPITGTPVLAMLRWSVPSGAVNFIVKRREGANPEAQLTPSPITTAYLNDPVTNPATTYEYQVIAYQADGTYGQSPWTSYTPPRPVNPATLAVRQIGQREVTLTWPKVDGASSYRVDGAGLPSTGAGAPEPYLTLPGLPTGTPLTWQVAAVYGDNLFDPATRPSASLTLPTTPWRSVPFLSMRNGTPPLVEQVSYYTTMASLGMIQDCSTTSVSYPWGCLNGANVVSMAGKPGPTLVATFADLRDMGAGRAVYCRGGGTPPMTETICWASTHGPLPGEPGWGDPSASLNAISSGNRGASIIRMNSLGALYLTTGPGIGGYIGGDSWLDMFGVVKVETTMDSEGAKQLPHVCLACHGGRYDVISHTVKGSSLAPLDPTVLLVPNRPGQEEAIRQMNVLIMKSNPSSAVADYIRGLYRGTPEAEGTTADDDYLPRGWSTAPDLYRKIVKPYCQGCHLQQQPPFDFATLQSFQDLKAVILTSVCTQRTMPHGEAAFHAFWHDGKGESLPEYMAKALGYDKCGP